MSVADEQSPPDPELTPEQESTVRRLLADARHDEGIPATVADRLDRVLAQLHEEQTGADAPVVELAARRRRRRAGRLLMAAAAIVLGGVTVGQFVQTSGDDAGEASSSSAEAGSARTASAEAGGETDTLSNEDDAPSGPSVGQEASSQPPAGARTPLERGLPVQLSADRFDQDVQELAESRGKALSKLAAAASKHNSLLDSAPAFDCPPAAYGRGTLLPAYYDDEPAVLAFRPPLGSNQVAELLRCGTAETLRSVDLAVPVQD